MKTAIAALIALGLIAGQANARTPFEVLADTAPRSSVFADLQNTAPALDLRRHPRHRAEVDLRPDPRQRTPLGRRLRQPRNQRALT